MVGCQMSGSRVQTNWETCFGRNGCKGKKWPLVGGEFFRSLSEKCLIIVRALSEQVTKVFRRGLGDLFVGLLYTMEASVPFVAVRSILLSLRYSTLQHGTTVFKINELILTLTHFIVRVLAFPLVYVLYARQKSLELWEAMASLPWHCHLGNLTFPLKIFRGAISWFFLGLPKLLWKVLEECVVCSVSNHP